MMRLDSRYEINSFTKGVFGVAICGLIIAGLGWGCGKLKEKEKVVNVSDDFFVEIPFSAQFGGLGLAQDLKCGTPFVLGNDNTEVSLKDFRYYISQVKFIKTDGSKVPLRLEQDGKWQGGDVALLDYANADGLCGTSSSPDAETRKVVRGLIRKDQYVGLEFMLGLDDQTNHLDATTARPPLNIPGLWWSWKGGYKEIRLELAMASLGKDYLFHHGATSCTGNSPQSFQCTHENNSTVSLTGDPLNSKVVFDLDSLFNGEALQSELSQNKTNRSLDRVATPSSYGCMGFVNDGDCEQLFVNLNLVFKDALAGLVPQQKVFSFSAGQSNVLTSDPSSINTDAIGCTDIKKVAIGDPCFVRSPALNVDIEVGDVAHPVGSQGYASHNQGTQCVQCHQAHGPGKGLHQFSGTIYAKDMVTPVPGAMIEIFDVAKPTSGPDNRSPVKKFFSDKSGNFYTTTDYLSTAITNANKEFWVRVSAGDGSGVKYMNSSKVTGQCSQCHIGGQRIYIDQ